jgi:hypothetical protein
MFMGDKWAECGLSGAAGLGSNRFEKAAQELDGFGEPLRKNAREVESSFPSVGGRVRHVATGKTGTVTYMGVTEGQSVAVKFDDGSVALCKAKDLEKCISQFGLQTPSAGS